MLETAMAELNGIMRKRHSPEEIAAKLRQAEQMAAQGSRQRDIAKALDISVMTFHRWRKRPPPTVTLREAQRPLTVLLSPDKKDQSQLQIENARLRRVVTDLLLEKLRLEDALSMAMRRRQK
jgi:putative transposase